jgi:hypothetical protein
MYIPGELRALDSPTAAEHLQVEVRALRMSLRPLMILRRPRLGQRGGVLLDTVLALALILIGAFALESIGISFGQLVHGAERFFGL